MKISAIISAICVSLWVLAFVASQSQAEDSKSICWKTLFLTLVAPSIAVGDAISAFPPCGTLPPESRFSVILLPISKKESAVGTFEGVWLDEPRSNNTRAIGLLPNVRDRGGVRLCH